MPGRSVVHIAETREPDLRYRIPDVLEVSHNPGVLGDDFRLCHYSTTVNPTIPTTMTNATKHARRKTAQPTVVVASAPKARLAPSSRSPRPLTSSDPIPASPLLGPGPTTRLLVLDRHTDA